MILQTLPLIALAVTPALAGPISKRWTCNSNNNADCSLASLAEKAGKLYFGTAYQSFYLAEPRYDPILDSQFNQVSLGLATPPSKVDPSDVCLFRPVHSRERNGERRRSPSCGAPYAAPLMQFLTDIFGTEMGDHRAQPRCIQLDRCRPRKLRGCDAPKTMISSCLVCI